MTRVVDFGAYFNKLDEENTRAEEFAAKKEKFKTEDKEGFFSPSVDKEGNATIVIRFLPPKEGETFPYSKKVQHTFEGPNGWFICNCLKEFNHDCPICKSNNSLYATKNEGNIVIAKEHKRKPVYVANILVVKNDNAPETVGKVFKLRYKSMFDRFIKEATKDSTDPETGELITGFNAFDYDNGANFIWSICKGKYGPDYSKSKFSKAKRINLNNKPLTDSEITKIDSQLYSLVEYNGTAPEDLDKEYERICNLYEKKIGEKLNISTNANLPKQVDAVKNDEETDQKSEDNSILAKTTPNTVSVEADDEDFWNSVEKE
jgi:hypothetical protein